MIEKYKKILIEKSKLEDNFPPGIFDENKNDNYNSSSFILRIIDDLIKENCKWNIYILRNFLLHCFSYRTFANEDIFYDIDLNIINENFINNFLKTITPNYYHSLIDTLSNEESEIILKNYLIAHQSWGKSIGVIQLVKSIIEYSLQRSINIQLNSFIQNKKEINENIISRLNLKNSNLGQNFILGNEFNSMSDIIEILIGPISYSELSILEKFGYAEGIKPSNKIINISKLCEPYYMNIKINFIILTKGFILGTSTLKSEKLGLSYS